MRQPATCRAASPHRSNRASRICRRTRSRRYLFGASYGEHRASLYDVERIADAIGKPLLVVDGIRTRTRRSFPAMGGLPTFRRSDRTALFLRTASTTGTANSPTSTRSNSTVDSARATCASRRTKSTLYVVSEFRATVAAFARDQRTGRLAPRTSRRAARARAPRRRPGPRRCSDRPEDARYARLGRRHPAHAGWPLRLRIRAHDEPPDCLSGAGRTARSNTRAFIETETQPRGFRIDPAGRFLSRAGKSRRMSRCMASTPNPARSRCFRAAKAGTGRELG